MSLEAGLPAKEEPQPMNGDTVITFVILAGIAFSGGLIGYSLGNLLGYKAGFKACSEIWDATEDEAEAQETNFATPQLRNSATSPEVVL